MASRAFTLIELLLVIAIIGVLSAMVLSSLGTARTKAKNTAVNSNIHQYDIALTLYFNAKGHYPDPGLNNTYYCIGNNPSPNCVGHISATLNAALQPYIPGLPYDPASASPKYRCITGGGSGGCSAIEFFAYLTHLGGNTCADGALLLPSEFNQDICSLLLP